MNTSAPSQTKDNEVYEHLRDRILRHEYRPGQRLREEELCRELKVTRTPLRLALRRLEHERLVIGEPYRGVHVREVSGEEIGPLFEMREVLEGLAARKVALIGDAAALDTLEVLARACDAAEEAEKWSFLFARDKAFHSELIKQSGNEKLCEVTEVYDFQLRTFSYHDQYLIYVVEQLREQRDRLKNQHQRLVEVLRSGDGQAAEDALRAHVRNSKEVVLAAWESWKRDVR